MRRILSFAAFLLIVSLVPVCAQRGGRGAGGGGHGGFGGAHGGFGGHGGVTSHGFAGPGLGGSHVAGSHGAVTHMASRSGGGFGPRSDHFRGRGFDRGFRQHRFGFAYGYPYARGYPYWGYYDPYWDWWWDSASSYDEDAARERQLAAEMNYENLQEQDRLRQQNQDQDAYARHRPYAPAAQPSQQEQAQNEPPTVLIFRDQHQREIRNYAIVGSTLWNFMPQRTEKIPLAQLDIPATEKANDDRGVEFHVPRASEGQ